MTPVGIAIEHLFATSIVLDQPPVAIGGPAVTSALSVRDAPAAGRWSPDWPPSFDPLVRHVGGLATQATVDITHPARTVEWDVRTAAHVVPGGSAPDIAPCYDAYWLALHLVDGAAGHEIVLHDPRLPAPMMERPDLRLRLRMADPPLRYEPEVRLTLRPGQLVLLPGWLRMTHSPSAGERTLLAFALAARLQTA